MNKEYPAEQREAAGEIDDAIFDKVAQDCPNARIMLVHQFGDYTARTHKKDGKPVVTRQVVRDRLVVFRARGVHFCQIPSSPASLRANVEVRLALKEHADRELGRRKDSSYDNDDVGKGMLDVLEILATGEQESPEYQASLNMEKTNELVAMVGNLRLEPLETIMAGVKEFGELYGGRGFTVESGRNGDRKRKAEGGRNGDKKRKAEGGKIRGAMTQGRICNQVGARENENKADLKRTNIPATTEDVEGGEGGNILGSPKTQRARGLCFGHTAAGPGLAAQIKASINLETGEILQGVSLCNTPEFEEPGLTLGLSTWKLDENCDLVLGYHNTNRSDKHPVCVVGGTVPAIQVGKEWLVARFALQYIKEGRIASRVGNNQRHNGASKRYRKKKLTQD